MNTFVLTVQGSLLYPENYTREQLEENYRAAYAVAAVRGFPVLSASAAAARAAWAAYWAAYYAAYDARYAAAVARNAAWADSRLKEFFDKTGENRQDYIDAVHKENK